MKGTIVSLGLLMIGSLSVYGQGILNFQNSTATRIWYETTPGVTTLIPAGNMFSAELIYAPDGTTPVEFDHVAIRVGAAIGFGGSLSLPGIFQGGVRTVSTITPAGGFGLFQVRVWETAAGSDYHTAGMNGRIGKSAILRVDTGDPTTVPPNTPVSLAAAGLASFTATTIPEPSTVALALLGVVVGILFVRGRGRPDRKRSAQRTQVSL